MLQNWKLWGILSVLKRFQILEHFKYHGLSTWASKVYANISKFENLWKSGALWNPSISNEGPVFSNSLLQNWDCGGSVFSCLNFPKFQTTGVHHDTQQKEGSSSTHYKSELQKQTEWKTQNLINVDYLYTMFRKCISRHRKHTRDV